MAQDSLREYFTGEKLKFKMVHKYKEANKHKEAILTDRKCCEKAQRKNKRDV